MKTLCTLAAVGLIGLSCIAGTAEARSRYARPGTGWGHRLLPVNPTCYSYQPYQVPAPTVAGGSTYRSFSHNPTSVPQNSALSTAR